MRTSSVPCEMEEIMLHTYDQMMFTAHTWRPATCMVFLLSGAAPTVSAVLEGPHPPPVVQLAVAEVRRPSPPCSPWRQAQLDVSKSQLQVAVQMLHKDTTGKAVPMLALASCTCVALISAFALATAAAAS